ncbi:MAG: EAL domain-containing protein [Treponema sp.]|nr:EAL domain-containing protein [Treponema sp.]
MQQDFNLQKYTELLQDFIEKSRLFNGKDAQALLKDICEFLKIGKISVHKTPFNSNRHSLHGDLDPVYYDTPLADSNRSFLCKNEEKDIVHTEHTFFQLKGAPDWTAEDKKRITYLSRLIFVNNSFNLMSRYISFTDTHDLRFKNTRNLAYFNTRLQKLINAKRIENFGVAFFNLHNFSDVNRNFGQEEGTRILETYLSELKNLVQKNKSEDEKGEVSAAGGDHGVVLFLKKEHGRVLDYLRKTNLKATRPDGSVENVSLSSHVGINLNLSRYSSAYEVMDTVSMAVNIAHKSDGNPIIYYDEKLDTDVENQREIEKIFKDAIKNEEFQVYYQPKVDLHKNTLKGAEALVRWVHNGKMIYPDSFIPVLERNLSIKYLDMYMLNHVCRHIAGWIKEGKHPVQVSVNLSRASLSMDNIVSSITTIIDGYNIPRSLIQIELTESSSAASDDDLRQIVGIFNSEGISTAMDDFGTGYSSLSLIKELPWDMLKIDKSLLEGAQKTGSNDQRMFKSIINMANDLGLECIVEGVETDADVRLLKESNCWLAQGYFFSKPVPKEEFDKKLS